MWESICYRYQTKKHFCSHTPACFFLPSNTTETLVFKTRGAEGQNVYQQSMRIYLAKRGWPPSKCLARITGDLLPK